MQDKSHEETDPVSNSSQEPERRAIDHFADAANQLLDVIGWLGNKLNSSGNVYRIEDALGATAEVSLSIPVGGTGEVTLVIGQSRKSYPAKAFCADLEFARGTKVRIADIAVSTMFVEAV